MVLKKGNIRFQISPLKLTWNENLCEIQCNLFEKTCTCYYIYCIGMDMVLIPDTGTGTDTDTDKQYKNFVKIRV